MKPRKNHTPGFKTKVVLEALQERETIQEIGKKYGIHPNQISTWKTRFISGASSVFENVPGKDDTEKERAELYKKVGQLQMEVDFLKKVLGK
ncbi:MAG: transposase [Bacteroidales bacterium]|nr:transposase [Bacteroidales bacterium]MDF1573333.1 transposase [Bacteroidales bacterium]